NGLNLQQWIPQTTQSSPTSLHTLQKLSSGPNSLEPSLHNHHHQPHPPTIKKPPCLPPPPLLPMPKALSLRRSWSPRTPPLSSRFRILTSWKDRMTMRFGLG